MHLTNSEQVKSPCQVLLCRHLLSEFERKCTNHIFPVRLHFHMWLLEISARDVIKKDL